MTCANNSLRQDSICPYLVERTISFSWMNAGVFILYFLVKLISLNKQIWFFKMLLRVMAILTVTYLVSFVCESLVPFLYVVCIIDMIVYLTRKLKEE